MRWTILFFSVLFLLSACSFNKIFLHPTKVPAETKLYTSSYEADTSYIAFDSLTHQPHFLDKNKDTIQFDFTIESVNFKSASGNILNGWFLKPKKGNAQITVLHLHGNAGFLPQQYEIIAPLINDGFQILMVDYSGFGFSEGKATRKNVLTDALSSLDYLKARPDVNGTKLIIYGQSLGGHASAVVAAQREADIDGLVMEGAFSSHHDIAAEAAAIFGRILVREIYSAKKSIQQFHKPVLIIHSKEDEVIPFAMGEKLSEYANPPKEFYAVEKPHICATLYYADSIAVKIKRMLKVD